MILLPDTTPDPMIEEQNTLEDIPTWEFTPTTPFDI
jgi:hypothetical protein